MTRPPSLRSRRDFQRVLRSGRRVNSAVATLFVARVGGPEEPARVGLAVASNVGGAVRRNRIKRRLRAAFAQARPPGGLEVVVRAKAEAASVPFQELEEMMQRAWRS